MFSHERLFDANALNHVSDALLPTAQHMCVGVAKVNRTTRSRASCCLHRIVATPVHLYLVVDMKYRQSHLTFVIWWSSFLGTLLWRCLVVVSSLFHLCLFSLVDIVSTSGATVFDLY